MIDSSTCDCGEKYSKYIDSRIGHVHTGQLDIIENQSLREIMQFGAKFREMGKFDKSRIYSSIEESTDKFATALAKMSKQEVRDLREFKQKFLDEIKTKLDGLKEPHNSKKILNKADVKEYLSHVHERFVIVPVDKAALNFAIICKKYYIVFGCSKNGTAKQSII